MRFTRTRLFSGLCLLGLGLPACFGHHTADEEVLIAEPELAPDAGPGAQGAQGAKDAGKDSGSSDCSKETDPIASFLCSLGGGGEAGIEGLVNGLLGGGMTGQDCTKQTDPIAQLLCTVTGTGGGGIEGLIGPLLGGGAGAGAGLGALLGDAGVQGIVADVLVDVIRGVIDDLIAELLGGGNREPGAGGLLGGLLSGGNASFNASNKSRELFRSSEKCSAVTPDDLLTRLLCARQALDTLRPTLPAAVDVASQELAPTF